MSLFQHNLNKCGQDVIIEERNMDILNGRAGMAFTNPQTVRAIVKTVTGVSVFDSTNTERVATHKLIMAYQVGITAENWVKIGSKRIKILTVENCAEADQKLILMCTERGDESKVVNEG